MTDTQQYISLVHTFARTRRLADIPAALCASEWLARSTQTVLTVSPSAGAFMDWLVEEDEIPLTRETWAAVGPNIAWYAAYIDTLLNRRVRETSRT